MENNSAGGSVGRSPFTLNIDGVHDGSKWTDIADLGSTSPENAWHLFKTTITDLQSMTPNFKVKLELSSFDGTKDLYIDELAVIGSK